MLLGGWRPSHKTTAESNRQWLEVKCYGFLVLG